MKIKLLVIYLLLTSNLMIAQKISIEKKEVALTIHKNEYFSNIETYDIIIQGGSWAGNILSDGRAGIEYAAPETLTYQHLMSSKELDRISLKRDTEDPDIRFFAGYTGKKPKVSNGQLLFEGYFKYIILNRENEILFQDIEKVAKYYINYPDEFPGRTNKNFHITVANALKLYAVEKIEELSLASNKKEVKLPYGMFKKVKKEPKLQEFNSKVIAFINKISNAELDTAYLSEMRNYFRSFQGKTFGKLKEKKLNRVLNLNLLLVEMFSQNPKKAEEYLTASKKGAGLFITWQNEVEKILKGLYQLKEHELRGKITNFHSDLINTILLKGTIKNKKKEFNGNFYIPRYVELDGNSLDLKHKPAIKIRDENDNYQYTFIGNEDVMITDNNDKEYTFVKHKSHYFLVENTQNECYKIVEGNNNKSGFICKQGDQTIIK